MENAEVTDKKLECPNCGYTWMPRVPDPKRCPLCKNPLRVPDRLQQRRIEKKHASLDQLEKITPVRGVEMITCRYCSNPADWRVTIGDKKESLCKEHAVNTLLSVPQTTLTEAYRQIAEEQQNLS